MTSLDSYLNTNCIQTGKHCFILSREKARENAKKENSILKKKNDRTKKITRKKNVKRWRVIVSNNIYLAEPLKPTLARGPFGMCVREVGGHKQLFIVALS